MPKGQAIKNVVNMTCVRSNVTKCIVSLTRSCKMDIRENSNILLRYCKGTDGKQVGNGLERPSGGGCTEGADYGVRYSRI
jgi:hypothetical protein